MSIKRGGDPVNRIVPRGGLKGSDVETVSAEEDSNGLDPCEVTCHTRPSFTDEMCVDVKVRIGDEAEVGVFLAVEVKGETISSNKTWVLANRSRFVAICIAT